MEQWFDSLSAWLESQPQWLGLAIFAVACLECLAVAGILIPGTVALFALGALAGAGSLGLGETLLLAYAGGLLGDLISYGLGRRFHSNIRNLPVLRDNPQWLSSAEYYFHRYGVMSLLVGRFIGPLRPMLPLVAGMLDMPFVRFVLVSMLAAAGWALAYLVPGWATGAALRLPLPEGFWGAAGVVLAMTALMLLAILQSSLREQRFATLLAAGLSALLLLSLLVAFPYLSALDQGLIQLVQQQRRPELDELAVLITGLGDFYPQLAAGALLCLILAIAKRYYASLFIASSMLLSAALTTGLKHLLARARPEILLQPLESFSLPSGHSSAAFALFLSLGVLAGRGSAARTRLTWLFVASLPALCISLSRVYLGVHWPTDIIAGALVAGFACSSSLGWFQRRAPLPPLPTRLWLLMLTALGLVLVGASLWHWPEALARYHY